MCGLDWQVTPQSQCPPGDSMRSQIVRSREAENRSDADVIISSLTTGFILNAQVLSLYCTALILE